MTAIVCLLLADAAQHNPVNQNADLARIYRTRDSAQYPIAM